jgi:hypothetical protein
LNILFVLASSKTKTLEEIWAPDPSISADLLPLRVNEDNYEELVVDPSAGGLTRGDKPFFLFFYYKKCQISQKFKPTYEQLA